MKKDKPTAGTFWTGLPGLDGVILPDGCPVRSLNVIGGAPGTGKTVLALQMLFANASPDNRALYFTTVSEPTVKFLAYLQNFDFYDPGKMFKSIVVRDIGEAIQTQPLPKVIELINEAIVEEDARIVVIDSFKAISDVVPQVDQLRVFAYNLAVNLVSAMCTAFLVGEYLPEDVSSVPIFAVADGILFLCYEAAGLNRQRYLEWHKVRGRRFFGGLHPFSITDKGIAAYPRVKTPEHFEEYVVPTSQVGTGLDRLDEMLTGGLPAGTATMVAGGAGTGKTLMGLHFLTRGVQDAEPGVIVTFQENPSQLRSVAEGFGWDLAAMEANGALALVYSSPVEIQPDIHAAEVKAAVERIGARRVLVDSLKDLEVATGSKVRYRDYIYSLVNWLKRRGITTVLTHEISELFGSFSLSEQGLSFITDNVILLRYVEVSGRVARALSVLKVRGSGHGKAICEYEITELGIGIGRPMRATTGVLAGMPVVAHDPMTAHLSPQARYVLDTLRVQPAADQATLEQACGLPKRAIESVLDDLNQQGLVVVFEKDGVKRYRATL